MKIEQPAFTVTGPPTPALDACKLCGGMGFLRVGGALAERQINPCVCTLEKQRAKLMAQLRAKSGLAAMEHMTFASFKTGDDRSLARALEFCKQFAAGTSETPWLVLAGKTGTRKTRLAVGIANAVLDGGNAALFMPVPDLLDHLRSAFGPKAEGNFDELFGVVRNVPLLVLDDFGASKSSEWAEEKLFSVFNHRYNHRLRTVVTTNLPAQKITNERIRSRLLDISFTRWVQLTASDSRLGGHT